MNSEPRELHSSELPAARCQLPASHRLRRIVRQARAVIARVLGVPDYEAYVKHLAAAHPGAAPLNQDAFVRERLNSRFSKPGARCC